MDDLANLANALVEEHNRLIQDFKLVADEAVVTRRVQEVVESGDYNSPTGSAVAAVAALGPTITLPAESLLRTQQLLLKLVAALQERGL